MSILYLSIVDCILYQWQTTMDLIKKYKAKSGQQLRSFIRKSYQTLIALKFKPKIKEYI